MRYDLPVFENIAKCRFSSFINTGGCVFCFSRFSRLSGLGDEFKSIFSPRPLYAFEKKF